MSDLAALAPMDLATRLPRLRDRPGLDGLDALVLSSPANIRYLSGFTGSAGLLWLEDARAVLITDGRYRDQAPDEITRAGSPVDVEIAGPADLAGVMRSLAASRSVIGLEADSVTWAEQRSWASDWFDAAAVAPTAGLVESLREYKDEGEVARIEAAAAIADQALTARRPDLVARPTEAEFAADLDATMRRLGASGSAFDTIVAAGERSALPHARPTTARVDAGQLVVTDFGAVVDGYRSDMTRMSVVGAPGEAQTELLEVVREAQAAGVDAVGPGVPAARIDEACRSVIEAAGYGDAFSHGTGHGVGLDIHEAPAVGARSTATLQVGHVVTVEPGIYVPGIGGVRWEDTFVVTDDGSRALTSFPKDPVIRDRT